jgi:hypothetical protein
MSAMRRIEFFYVVFVVDGSIATTTASSTTTLTCARTLVARDDYTHAAPTRLLCTARTFPESSYRTALPMKESEPGKSHGSRSHRLSFASYSSADLRPSPPASNPPATMGHPSTVPHAK